jgi:hypothetical protein
MRTYVRHGASVLPTREGPCNARGAASDDRRARRAPRSSPLDDLLLGPRHADPRLGAGRGVAGECPAQRDAGDEAQVPAAAGGRLQGRCRELSRARTGADLSGLRVPVHRRGVQAEPPHGVDLQLRPERRAPVGSLDTTVHAAARRLRSDVPPRSAARAVDRILEWLSRSAGGRGSVSAQDQQRPALGSRLALRHGVMAVASHDTYFRARLAAWVDLIKGEWAEFPG